MQLQSKHKGQTRSFLQHALTEICKNKTDSFAVWKQSLWIIVNARQGPLLLCFTTWLFFLGWLFWWLSSSDHSLIFVFWAWPTIPLLCYYSCIAMPSLYFELTGDFPLLEFCFKCGLVGDWFHFTWSLSCSRFSICEYGFRTSKLEMALKEATAYFGCHRMELQILPLPRGSGLLRTSSLVSQAVTTLLSLRVLQ